MSLFIAYLRAVRLALLMTLGACLALPAIGAHAASTIEQGRAAYAAGDYTSAVEKWQALIGEGRVEGLYFMGVMHAEGKGVPQDHAQAFAFYSQAAQREYVPAQYNLANQYATGEGVAQDFSQAAYWWSKAAERGLLPAQINLGNLYYHGAAGEKNAALARKWLTLAAAQGSAEARETLARLDAEEASSPKPAAEPAVVKATDGVAEGLRREAWVLSQPEHHYTIQIMAAGSDALARDFIQQQGLASRAAYIESPAQSATVYRIFYGHYPSRDLADKALAALPRALSANAPWVRSFAEVHKLVERRHAQRGAHH